MLRYLFLCIIIPAMSVHAALVSYWGFETIGTGDIIYDTQNSYDGVITGPANLSSDGVKGNALTLDGSNYVVVDDGIISQIQGYPFSVSCWVKISEQSSATYAAVWLGDSNSDRQYFQVGPRNTYAVMAARNEPTCSFEEGMAESPVAIDDGQWHNIVAVFAASGERELYLDGQKTAENSFDCPFVDSLNKLTFGCNARSSGNTDLMIGALDEVRLFSHALSDTEVMEYYMADIAVAHWSFDKAVDQEFTDRYACSVVAQPVLTDGIKKSACSFNGSSYINISDDILNELTDYPISIAYWFKTPDQDSSTYAALWIGNSKANDRYLQTGIRQSMAMLTARNPDFDLGLVESSAGLDDNKWHHAVAVYNSENDRELYIDGALNNTDPDSVPFVNDLDNVTIGRNSRVSATDYMKGLLDEIYIYNISLSDQQIQALYDIADVPAVNLTNDTLYLNSQSIYINKLIVDNGMINVAGSCVLDGNLELSGNMSIVFADQQSSLTIRSVISGSGDIVIAEGGAVTLQGVNPTLSGSWLVSGSLNAQAQSSLGLGDITVNNGGYIEIGYDLHTAAAMTLSDGATVNLGSDLIVGALNIIDADFAIGCYDSLYLYQVYDGMFLSSTSGTGSISVGQVIGIVGESDGVTHVTENDGSTDSFAVELSQAPQVAVEVVIAPQFTLYGNDIQLSGTDSPGSQVILTFDDSNWNIAQTVSVRAVADGLVEPQETATLSFTVMQNGDPIGIIKPLDVIVDDKVSTGLLADFDNNGEVAIGDLALLTADWLELSGYNLVGDQLVKLDDIAVLEGQWGKVVKPDALADFSSYSIDGNEVLFNCGVSQIKVSMCNSKMARVQLAPDRIYRSDSDPDYFMVQKYDWPQVDYTVTDEGSYIKIATSEMVIRAQKSPFRLQMYRGDNMTLLAMDSDSEGMYWENNTVGVKRVEGPGSGGKFGFGGGDHGNSGQLNKNSGFSEFTVTHGRVPVPFFMSTSGYGIFLNTFAKGTDFDSTGGFSTDDYLDYWFMAGPSFKSILGNYSELTGRMNLFPKWAYGFMLSKYGNDNATQDEFSDWIHWLRFGGHPDDDGGDGWPTDCYVFDYGWRGAKWNPHKWDESRYYDLPAMFEEADSLGFHVGLHNNYGTPEANKGNFTDPASAQQWWKAHLDPVIAPGYGDWFWPDEFDVVGDNLMANRAAKVVHEKWLDYTTQQRPMFITRGGFAGHHYACAWSGDIYSRIDEMGRQIVNQQAVGLSGYPWFSHDLGGFKTRPSDNLYIRWVAEFGSFCSIMRAHGHDGREPWIYSKNAQGILRKYLKLRYKLFPYIYTSAWQGAANGIPMMRAMVLEYQDNPTAWARQDQYFWGDWFLVAPAVSLEATDVNVWIPPGTWYDYFNGTEYTGPQDITVRAELDEIPVFVKAGAIVPMGPEIRYADEKPLDEITLDIYPTVGSSTYTLYEDDGITRDYLLNNAYALTRYDYSSDGSNTRLTVYETDIKDAELYSPSLPRDYYCRFNHTATGPSQVQKDGLLLVQYNNETLLKDAGQGWYYDSTNELLIVKFPDDGSGCTIDIQ